MIEGQRGQIEMRLDQLKEQLLQPFLNNITDATAVRELRRAANEAAALAWISVCPLLVLPLLLEEKLWSALAWWERQKQMRPRQLNADQGGGMAAGI